MVFKRLLGAIGVGGPSVDTVLGGGSVMPGGTLTGQVHVRGGATDMDIQHVTLDLVARVEAESGDMEHQGVVAFDRLTIGGGFRTAEGQVHSLPFAMVLPWETPSTELYGRHLGISLGVRTELAVAGGVDKGDMDPLRVAPLPAQAAVIEALVRLGFPLVSADLELGRIRGTGQTLPFYQEIEFGPAPQYAHALNQLEVTFLATPSGMDVVLEADKLGGPFRSGQDALSRYTVSHDDVSRLDWAQTVDSWVQELTQRRGSLGFGQGHYGHHGHHGGGHRHGRGAGIGEAAGGLAAGLVGGFAAAEILDEVGDFFEGDD